MRRGLFYRMGRRVFAAGAVLVCLHGCRSPGEWSRLVRGRDELEQENQRLGQTLASCERQVAERTEQVETLKALGEDRPADLFAPVSLEIAGLTGGADYDGQPGDDGVTVYVRPRDADHDIVKVPGRLTVQLLDNSDLANPRVVAVCEFNDPARIRKSWHGRFLTNHYSLECPFPSQAALPDTGKLTVTVTFADYLTGRVLSAAQEVTFSSAQSGAQAVGATP